VTGAELIAAERRRQVEAEDYTAEHDAAVGPVALVEAGTAYAIAAAAAYDPPTSWSSLGWWPWDQAAFKPTGDPVRDLTKAGALIAAAIDVELVRRGAGS
jgi:hypothetical protein